MKHEDILWRFLAVLILAAILVGSISAVSYGFDRDERVLNEAGEWSLKVRAGKYREQTATPAAASRQLFLSGDSAASPSNMLEQVQEGGKPGAIEVEWFRVLVDGETARDSERPHIALKDGREILPDGEVEYRMKAVFRAADGGIEAGDYVEWKLGTYPGLALPEESWEEVVIDGTPVGEAYLRYEDEAVCLGTVFAEGISEFTAFYITYTYTSGFLPVHEKTPLDFCFPGKDGSAEVFLLPVSEPGPSDPDKTEADKTEPDKTEPDKTEPDITEPETGTKETTEEESTAQEASEPQTTVAPTSSGKPSGGGSSGHDRGRSSAEIFAAAESTAPAETTAEETEPTEPMEPEETAAAGDKAKTADTADLAASEKTDNQASEQNRAAPPQIEAAVTYLSAGSDAVKNGDTLTCKIEIRNNGETQARNLRLRDYLPGHTSFLSASHEGVWGILDGQERITWKIDLIEPGESLTLEVKLQVYPCTPEGYRLEQTLYWQDEDQESVNSAKNPGSSFAVPPITIG